MTGCFVFIVAPSLAGKKMRFKAKNGATCEKIAPIRAIQISGTTSDFKMGVIKKRIVTMCDRLRQQSIKTGSQQCARY